MWWFAWLFYHINYFMICGFSFCSRAQLVCCWECVLCPVWNSWPHGCMMSFSCMILSKLTNWSLFLVSIQQGSAAGNKLNYRRVKGCSVLHMQAPVNRYSLVCPWVWKGHCLFSQRSICQACDKNQWKIWKCFFYLCVYWLIRGPISFRFFIY